MSFVGERVRKVVICLVCGADGICSHHDVCEDCGGPVEPRENVSRGYTPCHAEEDCDGWIRYQRGLEAGWAWCAAIIGMAEAIRGRPGITDWMCRYCDTFNPAGALECDDCGSDWE